MFRVLYHAPCPDGATAALVAALYFEKSGIDPLDSKRVSWHPMKVFLTPEEQFDVSAVCPSDEVFLLDYAANPVFVAEVAQKARNVVVLDHHLTALTEFGGAKASSHENIHTEFDVHRSGASIALDYFSQRFCSEALLRMQGPQASESSSAPASRVQEQSEPPPADTPPPPEPSTRPSKKKRKRGAKAAIVTSLEQTTKTDMPYSTCSCEKPVGSTNELDQADHKTRMDLIVSRNSSSGYSALLGHDAEGLRVLRLVRFIEDGDLYRWWLRDSREFHAGFGSLRLDYDARTNPSIFTKLRNLEIDDLIVSGQSSLKGENAKIQEGLQHAFVVAVPQASIRCLCIWTDSPELRSALGHALAERSREQGLAGLGMIVYITPELQRKGQIKVSLRGVEGADTLIVTEKFGGGGHKLASSCNVHKFVFDSWREDQQDDDD